MAAVLFQGMGTVLARTWSDLGFRARLLADAGASLREIGVEVPAPVKVLAHEATEDRVYLALSTPPIVTPASPLSDIRDFGCTYRQPALWSLNWLGRDPVASRRLLDDPKAALERFGLAVPDGLDIRAVSNTADTVQLILPPHPGPEGVTPVLLAHLRAGRVPASLRLGRLFGMGAYRLLLDGLSRPAPEAAAVL